MSLGRRQREEKREREREREYISRFAYKERCFLELQKYDGFNEDQDLFSIIIDILVNIRLAHLYTSQRGNTVNILIFLQIKRERQTISSTWGRRKNSHGKLLNIANSVCGEVVSCASLHYIPGDMCKQVLKKIMK